MLRTFLILIAILFHPQTLLAQQNAPNALSPQEKSILNTRITHILEKDQQFRGYLSYGTLDDDLVARASEMKIEEATKLMQRESELSEDQITLLKKLQLKNDTANFQDFQEIVKRYGYPSAERLGVKSDSLFVLLLHPPFDSEGCRTFLAEMSEVLLKEVQAGNMPAKSFATFVDNIRGKILRESQLYGTNNIFNSKTQEIEPPAIADIELTNAARIKIGLAPLKEGEYQIK